VNYDVYFYSCDGGRCQTAQFAAGWGSCSLTTDQINAWNSKKRWIRAYKDDGACWGEMDFDLVGANYDNLGRQFGQWKRSVDDFADLIKTGNVR
jgi:hypothetical protein